jgi:hypothetical protein
MSNELVPAGAQASHDLNTFEDCVRAAYALKNKDAVEAEAGIRTILSRAADLSIDDLQADTLINALHDATGNGKKVIKGAWKVFKEKADKAREEEERRKAGANAAAYAAQAKAAKDAIRDSLWASCSGIAESPSLLKGMTAVAHEIGVVHEDANVRAIYLTFLSRLLADSIRILRTGASSGGKNYPIEKMLMFFPDGSVIQFSGVSISAEI